MQRVIQPEFLDLLPPEHPIAQANRRDILRFNQILGNFRWIEKILTQHLQKGDRILEIGAGEGWLAHHLTPLLQSRNVQMDGLDVSPRPSRWPENGQWIEQRAQDFTDFAEYDGILACHFLHQLEDLELARLGSHLQGSIRFLVATEPVRRTLSLVLIEATRFLGMRSPSRHDARVSVRAGFTGEELARSLALPSPPWTCRQQETLLGAYRFLAE